MAFRQLTNLEIQALVKNRCSSEDWNRVTVVEDFSPTNIRAARFSGDIRLGRLGQSVRLSGGVVAPASIGNAVLHNCTVGDGVLIHNIGRRIANYDIGDGAVIDDVSLLSADGESAFGNGVEAEVLNEGGGREVILFDRLSSQLAYVLALYRHRRDVIEKIEAAIGRYVDTVRSARGTVGAGARIVGSGALINVRVGPSARVEGAVRLVNGSINSSEAAPAFVGAGVMAEDFITSSGSSLDGGAVLTKCFVGQGVRIGRQYSAENALFFANSELFHGEACAVFAGPYTVTHHKSSLLIAGLFSFYNAGSGTNQSNHMYKLGPVHQGILERGSKTGSFGYLMWSSRLGAFSAVIGKHPNKFDTSDFPFSYVMESEGKSILIPALNFPTAGTWRDGAKWPARDRRKGAERLDLIHFDVLNPYTVSRMLRGRRALEELDAATPALQEEVERHGVHIMRARFRKGRDLYDLGIRLYLNGAVVARLEALLSSGVRVEELLKALLDSSGNGAGDWVDLSGLLAPAGRVQALLDRFASGECDSIEKIESAFRALHGDYDDLQWGWVLRAWLAEIGKEAGEATLEDAREAIRQWRDATLTRNDLTLKDAAKEFDESARIGFGIDGDAGEAAADFRAVRGSFEGNSFVKEVHRDCEETLARSERLLATLQEQDCDGKKDL